MERMRSNYSKSSTRHLRYYFDGYYDAEHGWTSGCETIRAMGTERPDAATIPIIAVSANAFAEDIKASLDSGMNGHVSKPLNMKEVTDTIAKYIKS